MVSSTLPLNAPWGYLLYAVAAVALAALLFVGRGSLRRSVVLVAATASLSMIASIVIIIVVLYHSASTADAGYVAGFNAVRVLDSTTATLTYAVWGLLLYAAVQARRYGWFAGAALVMAIAISVPAALIADGVFTFFVTALGSPSATSGVIALVALYLFDQIATLLALVFAVIMPTAPAVSTPAGE